MAFGDCPHGNSHAATCPDCRRAAQAAGELDPRVLLLLWEMHQQCCADEGPAAPLLLRQNAQQAHYEAGCGNTRRAIELARGVARASTAWRPFAQALVVFVGVGEAQRRALAGERDGALRVARWVVEELRAGR